MALLSGSVTRRHGTETEKTTILAVDHDFTYHKDSVRLKAGAVKLYCDDGSTLDLAMEEMTTMYLRGGAYIGYKGVRHGLWKGPSWSDGEQWNVGDPAVADEVHGLNDTVCRYRCGDQEGFGIIENLILPPYHRYGFPPYEAG